jgi:hypothetical protein
MSRQTHRLFDRLRGWQQRSDSAGFPVSLAVFLAAATVMVGAVALLAAHTSTLTLVVAAVVHALVTIAVLGTIAVALGTGDAEASPRVQAKDGRR